LILFRPFCLSDSGAVAPSAAATECRSLPEENS
jgi:hypothetical protein